MSKRSKNIILIVATIQVLAIVAISLLPTIVEQYIPAQYWSYLPDRVIRTMGARGDHLPSVAEAAVVEVDAAALLAGAGISEDATVTSASELETVSEAAPEPVTSTEPLSEPTPEPTAEPTFEIVETVSDTEEVAVAAEAEPTAMPEPTAAPTAVPTPELRPTIAPLPVSFMIEGVAHEAQAFNNCGPTNLTLVLNYYGDDTDQLEAASYLKPNNQDRNVSPWQISDYVNEQTSLRSITRANGNQEMLKQLIAAGFPVVIEKGYDPEAVNASGWYGHYLTMVGFNEDKQEYYTRDTFLGPFDEGDTIEGYTLEEGQPYSYDYISYYWQQFNYTFYVVYEPQREAEIFDILGADLLDDVAMWTAAAQRAQEEINADDGDAFAWFNLGTALTRLGELTGTDTYYQNGALAFDKALSLGLPSRMLWYQHRPYIAYMKVGRYQDMLDLADATLVDPGGRNVEETYYYQGHARSFLGDLNGAAQSFQRSLDLNEFFYPAQFALDYVNSIR